LKGSGGHGAALIEHLHQTSLSSMPVALRDAARRVILDTVGCAIYGAGQPWVRIIADTVAGHHGPATAVGLSHSLHPAAAALINGTAAHGFELDDYIEGCFAHAGAPVVTAALATAEAVKANGTQLLWAIVAGYELMGRLGVALGKSRSDGGLHYTGQNGPAAAALAAGIVRGFNANELRNAVGIAASMGGGIKAFTQGTGGMVKRLHAGRAAEAGVMAAELTSRGFTGPQDALDGNFGLIPAIGGEDADPSVLSSGLQGPYLILKNWTKLYPCCAVLHAGCQAVEELQSEHEFQSQNIRRVRIGGSHRMVTQNAGRAFNDTMAAQYSMPFAAALALIDDASDPTAYDPRRVEDPAFQRALELVSVNLDPEVDAAYPEAFGARAVIELSDGRSFERLVMHPKGSGTVGVSPEQIESKFRQLTTNAMTQRRTESIIAAVRDVEASEGIAALCSALREGLTNSAASNAAR
jgi:2-methylcitrate dehydratase PrpD